MIRVTDSLLRRHRRIPIASGSRNGALIQTLGEPYVEYMKTRKRFVPFVF